MISSWLIPDWPVPATVCAVFSTRQGGCSLAPWDSMNLGDHVGDTAAHVQANRTVLQQATGFDTVFLNQVHGTQVLHLTRQTEQGSVADACISTERQLACVVMVADCLPILLTNTQGTVVAAVHAGWRGLSGSQGCGILESTLEKILSVGLSDKEHDASNLIAWLGPCIGPNAFEVGSEVRAAFVAAHSSSTALFAAQGQGKYLADLAALARQRLQRLGIEHIYGNDSSPAWCTATNPEHFFSHRRDAGKTGRMAACVWLA